MPDYYVNDRAQDDSGDHEVHESGCAWLKMANSKTYLGNYSSCHGAVAKAKTIYSSSNGCAHCCSACNTG
ncbi:MAG TPA: hypothetical protein DD982_12745 [Thalassospira sp.]|nr:hypothetical protein [Thalassospira sp.]HBS23384.1 hypothetical protein [Thalassospira sp.]